MVTPRRSGEQSTGTGCEGTAAADSSWAERALRVLAETQWLTKRRRLPRRARFRRCSYEVTQRRLNAPKTL